MTKLTYEALKPEYTYLWQTMEIKPEKKEEINKTIALIRENQNRYVNVSQPLNIPWFFIAIIHQLECGGSFRRHLHNGDTLSRRTTNVPKGRPIDGNPPFKWEESAIDALKYKRLDRNPDWSTSRMLYILEILYNGAGYRLYHPEVLSPYLWSYTNHYIKGKYGSDGDFDPELVSKQPGAATLLAGFIKR